ncbi:MAG: SagB/ThcOx family dehydrogenase [Lentisphaeria bacterium]|nr:SagB/ThcOx family dehydrogenase [Lentisphaeria bacterium]MDD6338277.1 SagB/ThcOx family dehydrogenase [Lentisphaeria bacterium]
MKHLFLLSTAVVAVTAAVLCFAQESAAPAKIDPKAETVALPAPAKTGGMPLMQALAERKTIRDYKPGELDAATLSEILYAANGVNRPDGKRTIPTAMNTQDLEVYVALPGAAYHYDAKANKLVRIEAGDFRADLITRKDLAANSACILVYAADTTKNRSPETKYSAIHVGEASQDVYLYAASKGLGTVSLGMYDEAAVRKVFKLDAKMNVILAQAVGFPK